MAPASAAAPGAARAPASAKATARASVPARAAAPAADLIARAPASRAPAILREVKPDYTEEGRRRHIEGDVVLEIVVRSDGTVGSVKLLQGLGAGLDQRAIDAVRQWRFSPAKRYGTPVDVIVEVAMEFKLDRVGIMDTTLVTVTLLSLAMAAALSVIVWRMLRDERAAQRARVAALATLAARTPAGAVVRGPAAAAARRRRVGALFAEHRAGVAVGSAVRRDGGARPRRSRRVILFALAATAEDVRRAPRPPAHAAAQPSARGAGLELLSLRDSRQAGSLTITGLVHNPAAARR